MFVEVGDVDVKGAVLGYFREKADAVDRPDASSWLHAFQTAAEQALPVVLEAPEKRPQVLDRGDRHVAVVDAKNLKKNVLAFIASFLEANAFTWACSSVSFRIRPRSHCPPVLTAHKLPSLSAAAPRSTFPGIAS